MSDTHSPLVDEAQVEKFEAAWLADSPQNIEACLPDEGNPRYLATLEELVRIDLEFSWKTKRGADPSGTSTVDKTLIKPPLVENYLGRFPVLDHAEIVSRLLREEFLVRHKYGDKPQAHELASRFPAVVSSATQIEESLPDSLRRNQPVGEGPGSKIGPYKILQKIGEGGFGVVYMAEQEKPVRRRVALKIIKAGMDTREVIARFEAERQALALMDHTNIARVLDAGATDSGRPYFVMELVKGISITDYCDKNKLDVRQRLELFIAVCNAVQHAHQKGIIHRDIKPSNALVTLFDGHPVPKIIDFGVAKATQQQLTERTMFTQYGQIIGTPQYMSPEQAEMNALDVDTRTDIYSLGVLLYELLTGTTPIESEVFRGAAFDEILRLIREGEPPRPSTRISQSGEALATVSAQRQCEPKKLGFLVKGDLDWIVMKALEKDRTRRYETANGLATDVRRHLDHEPVEASPPSTVYRLRKFAQKHRQVFATVGTVAVALVLATVLSMWFAFRADYHRGVAVEALADAEQQRDIAVKEKRKAEQAEQRAGDEERRARQAATLEKRAREEAVEERKKAEEAAAAEMKAKDAAVVAQKKAEEEGKKAQLAALAEKAAKEAALKAQQEAEEAATAEKQAKEAAKLLAEEKARLLEKAKENLYMAADVVNDFAVKAARDPDLKAHSLDRPRRSAMTRAVKFYDKLAGKNRDDPELQAKCAKGYQELAVAARELRLWSDAVRCTEKSSNIFNQLMTDCPDKAEYRFEYATSLNRKGLALGGAGQQGNARDAYSAAKAALKPLLDQESNNHSYLWLMGSIQNNLATTAGVGQIEAAETAYRSALELYKVVAEKFPANALYIREQITTQINLGDLYKRVYRTADAEKCYKAAVDLAAELRAKYNSRPDYWMRHARTMLRLGGLYQEVQRKADAEAQYRSALELVRQLTSYYPRNTEYADQFASVHWRIAKLYHDDGAFDQLGKDYNEALRIWARLVTENLSTPGYRSALATCYLSRADLARDNGTREDTERNYEGAIYERDRLHKAYPTYVPYQDYLAEAYTSYATYLAKDSRLSEADAKLTQALQIRQTIPKKTADTPYYLNRLAALLTNLKRLDEAEARYGEALDRLVETFKEHPENIATEWQIGLTHFELGKMQFEQEANDKAERSFLAAIEIQERFASEFRDRPSFQASLASSYERLGTTYLANDENEKAIELLRKGILLYQELGRAYPDVYRYQSELANAHLTLGKTFESAKDLPQAESSNVVAATTLETLGHAYEAKGRRLQAARVYQSSIAKLQALRDRHPDSIPYLQHLTNAHQYLGNLFSQSSLLRSASKEHLLKELELRQELVNRMPDFKEGKLNLAASHTRIGNLYRAEGLVQDATVALRAARDLLESLLNSEPENAAYRYQSAYVHYELAALYNARGKGKSEVLPILTHALKLLNGLVESHPHEAKHHGRLGDCLYLQGLVERRAGNEDAWSSSSEQSVGAYMEEATLHEQQGRWVDAEKVYDYALTSILSLDEAIPDSAQYLNSLAEVYRGRARARNALGKTRNADDDLNEVTALREELVELFPAQAEHRIALAEHYRDVGALYQSVPDIAMRRFQQGLDALDQIPEDAALKGKVIGAKAAVHREIGNVFWQQKQFAGAAKEYRAAVDLLTAATKLEPQASGYQDNLVQAKIALGMALMNDEDFKQAESVLQTALEDAGRFREAQPNESRFQSLLARSQFWLAELYEKTDRTANAIQEYQSAEAIYSMMHEKFGEMNHLYSLANVHGKLGDLKRKHEDCPGAVQSYSKEITALESLQQLYPSDNSLPTSVATAYGRRAETYAELGNFDAAISDWERVLESATGWQKNWARVERGVALTRKGDVLHGRAAANEVLVANYSSAYALYAAGRIYAVAAEVVKMDPSTYAKQGLGTADELAETAVDYIRRADRADYFDVKANVELLLADRDLDGLREREDFKELISKITAGAPTLQSDKSSDTTEPSKDT